MSVTVTVNGNVHFWTCGRKRRFRSRRLAAKVAGSTGETFGVTLGTYHCRFCGGHHIKTAARPTVARNSRAARWR